MKYFKVKLKSNQKGQALVEYLLIMTFIYILASGFIVDFRSYIGSSFGALGDALTINLSVGVCKEDCFFPAYKNSKN